MNCDEAFDCLTDGSLRQRPQLQAHLAECPRCRQMRDVLEPALSLFSTQAASPLDDPQTEANDAPAAEHEQTAFLSPHAVHLAQQTAADLSPIPVGLPLSRRSRWVALSRYAAVFFIGAFAALLFTLNRESGSQATPAIHTSPAASGCVWEDSAELRGKVRAPQVVKTCVACHLEQNGRESVIPFDQFLQPQNMRSGIDDASTRTSRQSRLVTTAWLMPLDVQWHVCIEHWENGHLA